MIHARGLGRRYGNKRVLADLDLDVADGELLLVTGANGAGKTTLLRLLAGLIVPTAGRLEVAANRARIGFLGHEPLVYRELTPLENLDLYGRLYRIPERRERIGMLLERFGLWDARGERTAALSAGMTQRLALCRTLLHDPELLLFDEPFSGLDDTGMGLLLEELSHREPQRTVVVSSHQPERLGEHPTSRLALVPA
jgi:ABC-type multidrug transport system ATPase subunit